MKYSRQTRDQLTWEKDVSFWYRFYFPIKMNSTKDMICHRMIFVKISVIPTFSFSLAHYFLFLLLILHLWLQYFTFSQSLFHFFLQEKGFPQTIQSFEGSNFFFIAYNDSVDDKSQGWELSPQSFWFFTQNIIPSNTERQVCLATIIHQPKIILERSEIDLVMRYLSTDSRLQIYVCTVMIRR